jgi:serine/threonine protein kinase
MALSGRTPAVRPLGVRGVWGAGYAAAKFAPRMSEPAQGCLESSQLLELAGPTDPGVAWAKARAHLAACPKCRARLAALAHDSMTATLPARAVSITPGPDNPLELSGPLAQGEMIGPYLVQELLAEGGMGVLYVAVHSELNRKVALKVIRPDVLGEATGTAGQLRLLREAQAMAKLSHPNVVTVFDAGTAGEKVFIAMELVEGLTLRRWLEERPRTWRETLAVFQQAGEGLAAAHRAGLMHRDFKPDNVLVSPDGRARVTDFGLARAMNAPAERATPVAQPPDSALTSTPMTLAGSVMGTPGYMAPEQARGETADARSDQFSFFAALWQGLYGELPGASALEPPPRSPRVPGRVHRVLVRGLSFAPDARFPTLDDALGALERAAQSPLRRARVPLAALGAALALAGVVVGIAQARRPALPAGCDAPQHSLTGAWDDAARAAVRASFLKTGDPGAPPMADSAVQALDAYARAWSDQHAALCEQSRLRPLDEQPLSSLACLSRQRTELKALADVLADADGDVVRSAAKAAGSLPAPARCRDPRALASMPKLPSNPQQRAEVEALRFKIAAAKALVVAGKPKQALASLELVFPTVQKLGYPPLEAEAGTGMGVALTAAGDHVKAEAFYAAAEKSAEISGDDLLAARAACGAAFTVGYRLGRLPEGRGWIERARVDLQRAGGDPETEARVENAEAALALRQGNDAEAAVHSERAWHLDESALGPEHPTTQMDLANVAVAYQRQCRNAEALPLLLRSIEARERSLGRDSTALINPHVTAANLFLLSGRFDEAEQHLDRAEEIARRAGTGEDSNTLMVRCSIRSDQGRPQEALDLADRLLQNAAKHDGQTSAQFANATSLRADALEDLGHYREALPAFREALALIEKSESPDSLDVAMPLQGLASASLALGRPQDAVPAVERALKILEHHCPSPGQSAELRFDLARALAQLHREPARVRTLADQAREELGALSWKRVQLGQVESWMRKQHLPLPPLNLPR